MFSLYRLQGDGQYHYELGLYGATSLWGKNGAVASCAVPKLAKAGGHGAWRVSEGELIAAIGKALNKSLDGSYALVDDLAPKGPEILMARILAIRGFLDESEDQSDADDCFNPILIVMQEILSKGKREICAREERERLKRTFPKNPEKEATIRTINYLWHSWQPPRSFSGALLWPKHWEAVTSELEVPHSSPLLA
ncbi:MAG: hypothetical protein WBQ72_20835 [Terriglobales bacterium]|jgi:hypothetical protein